MEHSEGYSGVIAALSQAGTVQGGLQLPAGTCCAHTGV